MALLHSRVGLVLAAASIVTSLAAQTEPQAPPFLPLVNAFLDAVDADGELRDRAVEALRKEEPDGLRWLGERLAAATTDVKRRQRLVELGTATMLEFIAAQKRTELTFRGQYSALLQLGPFANERLCELLLRPPDWFSEARRVDLVAAIADVQIDPPPPPVLLGITDRIEDIEGEPENLRFALACLVWQWGRKSYIEARVAELRAASSEGSGDGRLFALRQLADVWYRVREYPKAASTHMGLAAMAKSSGVTLTPTDWYWGACYLALSGRVDDGIAALTQCATLLADPSTDSSRRLPRKLFERDPEIARLRADPRFGAIVARAFGDPATNADNVKDDRKDRRP